MNSTANQLLIRSIIYLLAFTSAVRGMVVYVSEWQALGLVLLAFGLILALEPWVASQPKAIRLLYILVQPALMALLFSIARYADFWSLLLLPACYVIPRLFESKTAATLLAVLIAVMVVCLWFAEEGPTSVLFSSIYIVAYVMVWSFSKLILALEAARLSAESYGRELILANQKLRDLADQSAANAILQERTAVARELHDSVTQTLFSVNLMLSTVESKLGDDNTALKTDLEQIQRLSDSAMKELRAIITQLRPTRPAPPTFAASLGTLLQELRDQHGLLVHLNYDHSPIPSHACSGLLAIIREALLNVVKHAQVEKAEVSIHKLHSQMRIEIRDQGQGFDRSIPERQGHMGLESMRLASLEIGAELAIESAPEGGCAVCVALPVSTAAGGAS